MKYKYEMIIELKLKSLEDKKVIDYVLNHCENNGIKIGTVSTIPLKRKKCFTKIRTVKYMK